MIRPYSIAIEGFKSFRNEVTYHFPQASGLFLVTGRNKVEPKLQSNGVGKSSLFDAICWCLYGKSARGLKAGNVSHWSGEHLTSVQLVLSVDDKQRTIRRTYNPNSLRLDGEETDQKSIDQLIGVNYDGFLATVLLGQFNRFFFDLSPTEKLNVFSNALDLSQWTNAADNAKKRSKELATTLQQVETDQNATNHVIINIRSSAKNLALAAKNYNKDRQQSKGILQGFIQQREPELERTQKQLRKAQKELTRLLDGLEQLNRNADKLEKELNGDRHKGGWGWKEAEDKKNQAIHTAQGLERQWKRINTESTCQTCGQPIDEKHRKKESKRIALQLAEAIDAIQPFVNEAGQLREELDAIKVNQAETLTAIQRTQKELTETRKQTDRLGKQCNELRQSINRKKDQLNELDNQADPYRQQLTQLKQDEFQNQQKLERLTNQQSELSKQLKATEFWQKGFKELRLWVIQDAITQLQVEVDNALTQLGLHGWKVELAIEKETKQGKLTRGFTVNIKSPDSEGIAVPWESWSGGETQRIRLAGANALQKLIQQRNGIDWRMECWDEPTQHLSERGIDDLLVLLEAKAKTENRQIWIITHQGLTSGNFEGQIEVVKGVKGSRIVEVA